MEWQEFKDKVLVHLDWDAKFHNVPSCRENAQKLADALRGGRIVVGDMDNVICGEMGCEYLENHEGHCG